MIVYIYEKKSFLIALAMKQSNVCFCTEYGKNQQQEKYILFHHNWNLTKTLPKDFFPATLQCKLAKVLTSSASKLSFTTCPAKRQKLITNK